MPLACKKIKLFSRDKHEAFSLIINLHGLLDEFKHNDNLDSNTVIKKLLVTTNEVGDEIQEKVPKNLQGSAFNCPALLTLKNYLMNSIYFIKRIKNLNLEVIYLIFKHFVISPKDTGIFLIVQLVLIKILR